MICWVLAMEMLQGVWKQHLRPSAVVGYGIKIFPPSPPNYVTRSPGTKSRIEWFLPKYHMVHLCTSTKFDSAFLYTEYCTLTKSDHPADQFPPCYSACHSWPWDQTIFNFAYYTISPYFPVHMLQANLFLRSICFPTRSICFHTRSICLNIGQLVST